VLFDEFMSNFEKCQNTHMYLFSFNIMANHSKYCIFDAKKNVVTLFENETK